MKALTASRSMELGIPNLILMEEASHRVAEFLIEKFAPLSEHHVVIL